MFYLDSELDRIIGFNSQWKNVINKVREVYSGSVTSCHTIHTDVINFEAVLTNKTHWFYDLDILSISDYAKAANQTGCTVDQMVEALKPRLELHRRIANLYGKPILFGEVGCTSSEGGAISPSGWKTTSPYCGEEQANYLEAVMQTYWNEPWWHGIYWWKWDEQNNRPDMKNDPRGDKGFTVRGKPAQDTMRKWFTRTDVVR